METRLAPLSIVILSRADNARPARTEGPLRRSKRGRVMGGSLPSAQLGMTAFGTRGV
jgi:hypothetical protein